MTAEHEQPGASNTLGATATKEPETGSGWAHAVRDERDHAVPRRERMSEEQRIQEDIPWGVRIAASWSWRVLIILAFTGVMIWLLSYVSLVIISLLIAALLATLMRPVHNFFRKLKFPAILASLSSIVVLVGFVVGLLYLVGQEIIQGFAEMADQVTRGLLDLLGQAEDVAAGFGVDLSQDQVTSWLSDLQSTIQDHSDTILGGAMTIGTTAGNIITGLILALFTLIFFLSDGRRMWDFSVNFVPRKHRPAVHGAGRRGWAALSTYVRVQVFVAAVDAVGIGIGAAILGVPLALPVAVLVFLGAFIPIIGAVLTGAIAVLLALVANGLVNALLMLGVVLLVQQLESNVLQPIVMGKAVNIHPLAVVLAVTGGTLLLGIVGALFAVPVLAFLNRAVRYVANEEWRRDDEAVEMDRRLQEEGAIQEVEQAELEAEELEKLAGLKSRIKASVPSLTAGFNPHRGHHDHHGGQELTGHHRGKRGSAVDEEHRRDDDRSGGHAADSGPESERGDHEGR
ncbi:AI-2E family transporter [Nesterenkonia marinintestina]|uniref:AI-2E family transporter n=1 Tax=Nesterenkonia marinintestina TaxID=2979865 RepID=UPI0021BF6845|nr:AI-2E family transporter [Nesterenkonia sp. GX14115]